MGGSEQAGRTDHQGLMLRSDLTATQESREGDDVASRCCSSWTKRALPSSCVQLEVREDRQSSRIQRRVTRTEEQELTNAWPAWHVGHLKTGWEGVWRPRLPAPSSGVPQDQEQSVPLLPQHQENSSVPSQDRHSSTFPSTLSGRDHLQRSSVPVPLQRQKKLPHTQSNPRGARLGSPTANAPLSIALSLCAPPTVQDQGSPGTARAHLSPDAVDVSCAASTPSTLVGRLLLWAQPPPPAPRMLGARACSTGACRRRGGARARPPASSGPYRVCCCRWESWRKAFWQ